MDDIIVRQARLSDADALSSLGKETFIATYENTGDRPEGMVEDYANVTFAVDRVKSELENPKTTFLIVEYNERRIGFAKLDEQPPPKFVKTRDLLFLGMIYLLRTYQRRGIGIFWSW